jgi:hypothetical protein
MKTEGIVQEARTAGEAKPNARAQLAQHLEQQSQSRQTFDKFMKGLEVAGLALIAAYLGWAIYVSINWSVPRQIVAVWFAFPVCAVALLILVSLHGAGIRAFFPIIVPGSSFPFVTGSKAVGMGLGFAVALLVAGTFWGAFAWGIWMSDWSLLEPLAHVLGVVVGVGVVFALVSDLYRRLFRSR